MSGKNGLPEGWSVAHVGELVGDGLFSDGDWVETKDQDPDGEVRLTQLADVGDGFYRNRSARFMTLRKAQDLRCTFLEPGDVMVARMPDPLGRACIFPGDPKPCVTAVDVCVVRTGSQGVDHRWLMHTINCPEVRSKIFGLRSGSTRLRVSKSKLASVRVPVPPLAEQRRIVAAIEAQFSRLDAGVASLERARVNLKRYRTAVLKAAVEGRLTEAWREENPDMEPASELLDRILEERRRRWEEDQLAAFEKKGKKPPKDWQAKYKEPTAPDRADLPELPEGWLWASVEQLTAFVKNGLSRKPAATPPGHRILRISAVRPMKVDLEDVRFLDLPKGKMEGFVLDKDDLLFTRYNGSLGLLGVVGRIGSVSEPTLHPDKLVRVKVVPDGAYAAYLELACNVGASRRHVERRARTTAGQTGISGTDIRQIPVPVPSRAEQEQIVEETERRMSVLREVEAEVEANLKRAGRLRQSILKRAFEGRLVEQDPTDQPAGELLARIRAERERNAGRKGLRKGSALEVPEGIQASLFPSTGAR